MKCKHDRIIRGLVRLGVRVTSSAVVWPNGDSRPVRWATYAYFSWRRQHISIARLVCWLRHGPPTTQRWLADHIDQNKHNNCPSNLRWLTKQENTINCLDRGSFEFRAARGGFNRRLARAYGRKMRAARKENSIGLREMARAIGVSAQYIHDLEYGIRIFNLRMETGYLRQIKLRKEQRPLS